MLDEIQKIAVILASLTVTYKQLLEAKKIRLETKKLEEGSKPKAPRKR